MSENLWIENDSGTYKFDDAGFSASNGTNTVKIQPNNSGELFSIYKGNKKNFYVDASGNLHFEGDLTGATGTFSGLLSGGSINIGNGTFTVDKNGNMYSSSGTFAGLVSGGEINIGNGTFTVEKSGKMTATSCNITGNISSSTMIGGTISSATIISSGTNGTTTISGGTVESVGSTYDASLFKLSFGNRNMYLQPQGIVINDVSSSGINQTTISDSIISLSYTRFSDGKKYEVSATPVDLTIPAGYVNECNGGDTAIPNVKWVKNVLPKNTTDIDAQYTDSSGDYTKGTKLIKFNNATSGDLTGATPGYVKAYVQKYVDAKSKSFYNAGYSKGLSEGKSIGYDKGYSAGKSAGYSSGYNKGYAAGLKAGSKK